MDNDFLTMLQSHGLLIDNLTAFQTVNSLNATQLFASQLKVDDGQSQPIFIKRLVKPNSAKNYQQFCQEIECLTACQCLALENHAAKKKHYGIPKLLAYSKDMSFAYLALPLYQGQTLKTLMAKNTLTFEQKIDLAIGCCYLLNKLHCLGYLHRDIKPSNILITDSHQVILLDFALSQKINNSMTECQITAGTPAYMSPEQFSGQALAVQSDYYSFGIMLFELLVGQLPFRAPTLSDWAFAHAHHPIPQLTKLHQGNLTTPTDKLPLLQTILNRLLAKYPKQRYTTLDELISDLARLTF